MRVMVSNYHIFKERKSCQTSLIVFCFDFSYQAKNLQPGHIIRVFKNKNYNKTNASKTQNNQKSSYVFNESCTYRRKKNIYISY